MPRKKMNKAARLAVAGYVAPPLRSASPQTSQRRVARVDKDGNVVGYTTLAEVQRSLLARQDIELEVAEGVRPRAIVCRLCGKVVNVPNKGAVPFTCLPSAGGCARQERCAGWGSTEGVCVAVPRGRDFSIRKVAIRKGGPWRCIQCSVRRAYAAKLQRQEADHAA